MTRCFVCLVSEKEEKLRPLKGVMVCEMHYQTNTQHRIPLLKLRTRWSERDRKYREWHEKNR